MRRNIKMRVTPATSAKVQKIAFMNNTSWVGGSKEVKLQSVPFLIIIGGTLIRETNENLYSEFEYDEVDADLFIRTNGHCYQNGDVVTLGDKVSEKFQGLTGTLSNVAGDTAILNYKGGATVIRLDWIDPSYEEGEKGPVPTAIPEPYRQAALTATLNERGQRYGDFGKHAQITQDLKAVMADTPNWETLTPSAKEALEMIAHKIGRILNGDPTYADSWHDIAGYATLVEKECE